MTQPDLDLLADFIGDRITAEAFPRLESLLQSSAPARRALRGLTLVEQTLGEIAVERYFDVQRVEKRPPPSPVAQPSESANRPGWMSSPVARAAAKYIVAPLAIVAVTLAAGLRAAGALVDGSQRLADVTAAQWCAENQLAELRLTRQFPGVGDGDFTCEMLGRTYAGTLRTRPTPNPNFRRVDAVVRDDAQRPIVTVSAVVTRL